jgi:hypothetical protein
MHLALPFPHELCPRLERLPLRGGHGAAVAQCLCQTLQLTPMEFSKATMRLLLDTEGDAADQQVSADPRHRSHPIDFVPSLAQLIGA